MSFQDSKADIYGGWENGLMCADFSFNSNRNFANEQTYKSITLVRHITIMANFASASESPRLRNNRQMRFRQIYHSFVYMSRRICCFDELRENWRRVTFVVYFTNLIYFSSICFLTDHIVIFLSFFLYIIFCSRHFCGLSLYTIDAR